MLKLENISLTFNPGTVNEKKALDGVTLSLPSGQIIGLLGRNGSGNPQTAERKGVHLSRTGLYQRSMQRSHHAFTEQI